MVSALAQGRQLQNMEPTPFAFPGQLANLPQEGWGVCDPNARNVKQAVEGWRFSTIYLTMNVVGTDLQLPATQSGAALNLFGYGPTNAVPGMGTVQATGVDTDVFEGGTPIREGERYYGTAAGIELLAPFTTDGTALKTYPAWLSAYRQRIYEALLNNLSLELNYGDNACKYVLGVPAFWPQHANALGSGIQRNGAGVGPAQLTPFRRALEMGSRKEADKATIAVSAPYTITIGADPLVPIPAGVTSIRVPLQALLYGFSVCAPCVPACGPTGGGNVVTALAQLMADPNGRQMLRQLLDQNPG